MSAGRALLEIERRARARKQDDESSTFELEISTAGGHTYRGPLLKLSNGDNIVELGSPDCSTMIMLDQITSVRAIWLKTQPNS